MNAIKRLLAVDADHYRNPRGRMDAGQFLYDFFRSNFSSVRDLEKNGMKALKDDIKRGIIKYSIDPSSTLVKDTFDLARQDMFSDTPESEREY